MLCVEVVTRSGIKRLPKPKRPRSWVCSSGPHRVMALKSLPKVMACRSPRDFKWFLYSGDPCRTRPSSSGTQINPREPLCCWILRLRKPPPISGKWGRWSELELTRSRGHLILGKTPEEEPAVGRPSIYPEEFRREACELARRGDRSIRRLRRAWGFPTRRCATG